MCQVTPFTLPCCRRIYVQAEKLPSCPENWPRKKCPKELIVQISGYEPKDVQHRAQGLCWRCLADKKGKNAWEREQMRPDFDRAFVVEGLEEWSMEERRTRQEQAGLCWHCGGDRRCKTCGSGRVRFSGEKEVLEIKVKRGRGDDDMGKGMNKKMKVDDGRSSMATLPSMVSTPDFQQQHVDPSLQHYDYSSGDYGRGLSYDHFMQPVSMFNYQPQEVGFQSPIPRYVSGSCQGTQGFQSQKIPGRTAEHLQIDPKLYQQQGREQEEQNSDLPLRQQQDLSYIPDFEANSIDLDAHNDINDETVDRLLKAYTEEVLKSEKEDMRNIAQMLPVPQIDPSLGST